MDLKKGTFISSVSDCEEEYYLSKNTWSAVTEDWKQRFEVGDIVADPAGDWDPSTAEQYIDQQIGIEASTRLAQDTYIQSQIPLADEEDITKNGSYLKFKDRIYNQVSPNGMGCIYLRKKDNFKTVIESVTQGNTIFVIRYDFTLTDDVTIPPNCVLEFYGGSISGEHKLTGNNTLLSGDIKCLVTIADTFANDYLDVTWFGAVGDDTFDNSDIINNVIECARLSKCDVFIPEGTFALKSYRLYLHGEQGAGTDKSKYKDYNNIVIKGIFKKSIIKGYYNGDLINIAWVKNLHLKDLTVTLGNIISSEDYGTNLVSLIDASNVSIDGCHIYNAYRYWGGDQRGFDGGKGITLQANEYLFENIRITNCDIDNCYCGLDIEIAKEFYNNPLSYIYAYNINITKCSVGVSVSSYDTPESTYPVNNGLINLEARTTNCQRGCAIDFVRGITAHIDNVADQTVQELLLDGNGNPWVPSGVTLSDEQYLSVFGGQIKCPTNSNIEINSYYKQANYGYIMYSSVSRTNGSYICDDNIIKLNLSKETEIVKHVLHPSIVHEAKFYYNEYEGFYTFIKNSLIVINGCDIDNTIIRNMLSASYDNSVFFIIDGEVYSKSLCISKIYNLYKSEDAFIDTVESFWKFKYRISSNSFYPVIGIADSNNDNKFFICGDGSIGLPSIDINRDAVAGGSGLGVRLSSEWSTIVGYVPIQKGRSKGASTERPNLTSNDSGAIYYDTTLNKPIWWTGSTWVDATGTSV